MNQTGAPSIPREMKEETVDDPANVEGPGEQEQL